MLDFSVSEKLKKLVPDFKVSVICYHHIVISELPPIISERLPLFYENIKLSLENQPFSDIPGIKEWRSMFKQAGTDPSRYRPSQEALLRKIKKDGRPHMIHSAVDLNNFFSVQYSIPMGIYDLAQINAPVRLTVGTSADTYDGLNGRMMNMENKIISADSEGAFGSPIVDSRRTCVTEHAEHALQIVYLRPSMPDEEAQRLTGKIAEMFTQVHGGENEWTIIR
ncbi:B3/4 domain-containing protein [Sporolactobacillus pectinivorans]|uniref:B3/B4 domain-containing protein n=1 Tax=Sporolactobacillus pectinivorans TaxID=1591408 RepID=UPI000C256B26|nr:phenylalanine--tRNA ligase beta subunit-related protein [Sporolactobacillus pectinivorans]